MASRGDTRPMELGSKEGESRLDKLERHHEKTLWIPWALITLGVWLLLSPSAFGYGNPDLWTVPSGGRGVWFSQETLTALRANLTIWSDVVAGALLVVFGWRALTPNRPISRWAACLVGVWLVFAPVLLWAPTAAAFANDSLVGILVISLTILIPGMPNMIMFMQHGPDAPPGWSYNPSSWPQRWILIVLGFAGLVVSRYLAAYQMGYVDQLWDPFFGWETGTQMVLDSNLSHMWPVSDAGMGAVAYTFEFLMGFMGATSRWRTMPWMVTIFGILVIPLGLSHIALVMSQPIVVHAWCTFCLLAAAIMLPMIPLEVDEVVAMGQHVKNSKRRGDRGGSIWKIFWLGGSGGDSDADERTPPLSDLPHRWEVARSSAWGVSTPWTLTGGFLLGVAMMAMPATFGVDIRTTAADIAHLGGAAIAVVSVVAMGEVLRAARWLSIPIGLVVAALAFATIGGSAYALTVALIGVLAAVLSLPRGVVREAYGDWGRLVR